MDLIIYDTRDRHITGSRPEFWAKNRITGIYGINPTGSRPYKMLNIIPVTGSRECDFTDFYTTHLFLDSVFFETIPVATGKKWS